MADASVRGRFLWYDTMTKSVEGAVAFYAKVVGWGTQQWEGPGQPYQMWTNGAQAIGGLMQMPPQSQAPPHWMGYIGTLDVDQTVARAAHLGAAIMVAPADIPTVGRFSVIRDPQGATFAAFAPTSLVPAPDFLPKVGEITWHELITTDIDEAFAFYSDLFGWVKKDAMDMGPMGIYQMYGTANATLGGIYRKPQEMPAPPHFLFYIGVADLGAAVARVTENAGQVLMGPHEVPGGDRIAICVDPQGAAFALHWKKD